MIAAAHSPLPQGLDSRIIFLLSRLSSDHLSVVSGVGGSGGSHFNTVVIPISLGKRHPLIWHADRVSLA